MKKSVWSEEVELSKFDKLKGEVNTDVLIIGGGLCGILSAYFLQKSGVDYVLVEGGRIAAGITKNTTAKITSKTVILRIAFASSIILLYGIKPHIIIPVGPTGA